MSVEVNKSWKPVGVDILDEFKSKAALVEWNRGKRKEDFILFSVIYKL